MLSLTEINLIAERTSKEIARRMETTMTMSEVCTQFNIKPPTLNGWIQKQGFPFHEKNGRKFFYQSEINEYIKS